MEKPVLLNILLSAGVMILDFVCSFWIFLRAIASCGVTFYEMLQDPDMTSFSGSRLAGRWRLRQIQNYLSQRTDSPDTLRGWLRLCRFSSLPGALAVLLLILGLVLGAGAVKYILLGNIVLLLIVAVFWVSAKVYQNGHPLTPLQRKSCMPNAGVIKRQIPTARATLWCLPWSMCCLSGFLCLCCWGSAVFSRRA